VSSKHTKNADVVVIGGGVLGCTIAYYLSRIGITVLLVEANRLGSGASGLALGGLDPTGGAGIPGPLEPLARESLWLHHELHNQLVEDTAVDNGFNSISHLTLALGEDEALALREQGKAQHSEEFPTRWLSSEQTRSLEPDLNPSVSGALQTQGIAMLDSASHMRALTAGLEKHDVDVEIATLEGIEWSGQRVSAVILSTRKVAANTVILAIGPWSGMLGPWLGTPVPIRPLKGQIVRLRTDTPRFRSYASRNGMYLAAKPDGLIWTGTTEETAGFNTEITDKAREHILGNALELLPALRSAAVVRQTACLRPLSTDGLPILGRVPNTEGVFLATGGGRKGIELSTGMSAAIVDMVANDTTGLPIAGLGLDRFERMN
jgi:glycine oxidase